MQEYVFGVAHLPGMVLQDVTGKIIRSAHLDLRVLLTLLIVRIVGTCRDIGGGAAQALKRELAACTLRDFIDNCSQFFRFPALTVYTNMVKISKGAVADA
jgi:hypothetical protein